MPQHPLLKKEEVELALNDAKRLMDELEVTEKLLLPALGKYLDDVRSIRMAFAAEVRHIIQSSREVSEITKMTPHLKEVTGVIMLLKELLTPEMIAKLERLVK